jgi:Tfp pilus assembly protein PilX
MLTRLRRDEEGVALITAMLIVFVITILATVVIDQSIHNSFQSASDRKRLQSVDASEAGLNYFYNYMERTAAQSLTSTFAAQSVGSAPGTSSFSITPTWYGCQGLTSTQTCAPPFSDTYYPQSVKVLSTGTTNGTTTRKMETYVVVNPTFGGFEGAVLSGATTNLVNSFTISGNNGNDGDITVNCDGTCNLSSSSGNQTIKGNLYAPKGNLLINTQVHIYGNVWADGSVTINHPNAQIDGDVISSASSVVVSSGTVNGKGSYCTTVSGTANIKSGTVNQCQGPPPAQAFPHVTYDDTVAPLADAKWRTGCSGSPVTNCYQLVQFSGATACTAARTYVEGTGAGTFNGGAGVPSQYTGVIVRILSSSCTFDVSNNASISLGKDLAIISNGPITLQQRSTWTSSTPGRKIHLIVPWPQTCVNGNPGVSVGNNTGFSSNVAVGIYTPCTATMGNQNAFYGQVVGGVVSISNNWSMIYRPIVIPGAHVNGFTEDIAYIREVS